MAHGFTLSGYKKNSKIKLKKEKNNYIENKESPSYFLCNIYKNKFMNDYRSKCKTQNVKLLEENIGEYCCSC